MTMITGFILAVLLLWLVVEVTLWIRERRQAAASRAAAIDPHGAIQFYAGRLGDCSAAAAAASDPRLGPQIEHITSRGVQ